MSRLENCLMIVVIKTPKNKLICFAKYKHCYSLRNIKNLLGIKKHILQDFKREREENKRKRGGGGRKKREKERDREREKEREREKREG